MGRIVTFVVGLGVVLGAVWYVMNRPARTDPQAAAARQLENVHKAADRLGGELQKGADDIMKKTEE
ncbi:hypothetical protein DRW03_14725 [Corallococcus sp. H22C18031201]|uniref:hypothetical protein n=1 Tax=Citreicoccus inhibens TaxID=2849499 RepID=UPI000E7340FA|nr:hypothetical protein [Citreicoccus inhibens]MBJ6759842.1 hypothetical protein [Myxococcaceae bacterium JPH2]MBU8895401.1 hypothetical protein [Citreicoccus inhibens]RJS22562.1 hypothetical protein DRW03_14725 [Corallococcus sp. H22C18031201]